jgi:hypothetical protein
MRLKAESRMRVAIKRKSSSGALAIENVRTLPSASVSGGSTSVRSMYWPAWKVKATRLLEPECQRALGHLDPVQELYEGGPHGGALLCRAR